jgi:hypothetical protein
MPGFRTKSILPDKYAGANPQGRGNMSRLKPESAWRGTVEDTKLPAKSRILALEQIARPSLNLLRRFLAAKSTSPKLRPLAAQKYEIEIARLAARKEVQAVPGPPENGQAGCMA